ncbi:MAG: lysophospholipid acyltransferase family protein [Planctomycetota bacterium]
MFQKITLLFLRLLSRLIQRLPLDFALKIGDLLGMMAYFTLRKRNRIILTNLRFAYGFEKSEKEFKEIMWRMYRNFGKCAIEFFRLPVLTTHNIDNYVKIEGLENLKEALSSGKGAFILTAHFGNWDMLASICVLKGFPVNLVTKYLKNEALNKFWLETRRKMNITPLYREGTLKEIMRHLKNNELMGFVLDQSVRKDNGVFINFFGKPTCTMNSLAILSHRLETPVVPLFLIRLKNGYHRAVFEKQIIFKEKETVEAGVVYNTQIYSDVMEKYIRQYPDHWIWMHRRWKTLPEGYQKVY